MQVEDVPQGRDDEYGHGQLDVIKALTAPRTKPSETGEPAATGTTVGPPPIESAPVADKSGIPPLIIVAVGVLLLIVALAAFMIVRAARR